MKSITTAVLSLGFLLMFTGCSSTDTGDQASNPYEGLDTVQKNARSELYVRVDTALPLYNKLIIEPVTVSYSNQQHNTPGLPETDYQFDESELARFQEQFTKAVTKLWISTEGHSITDKPDGKTLIMRVNISDLYLYASIKNNQAGRETSLVKQSSTMVINMDLLDAESGEILIKSKDKRTTGYQSGPARQMSSVSYFNDVYQSFRLWINQLSSRLD